MGVTMSNQWVFWNLPIGMRRGQDRGKKRMKTKKRRNRWGSG